jgi:eukaryotic-like serine/threonine-protein kinase
VHRDLKPDNIFVCTDGRLKILDFGLAKLTPPPGSGSIVGDASTLAQPTSQGVLPGTVGYMAPEQIRGDSVDRRADLFSFGCVLFEMLANARAFQRGSPVETLSAILHDPPVACSRAGVATAPSSIT